MNEEEIMKKYNLHNTKHDFYFEKYCILKQENQQLKDKVFNKSATINKVKQFCENKMVKMKKSRNSIAVFLLIDILKIVENGDSNE